MKLRPKALPPNTTPAVTYRLLFWIWTLSAVLWVNGLKQKEQAAFLNMDVFSSLCGLMDSI
jgi:hypothetical protein